MKRHGCPSHGIGLTPDEKELWLADGAQRAHAHFRRDGDATEAGRDNQAARSARVGHLQHGWAATPIRQLAK